MMCLGWYNRPTCAARKPIDVATGLEVSGSGTSATPSYVPGIAPSSGTNVAVGTGTTGDAGESSTWFWGAMVLILVGGYVFNEKKAKA